MITMNIETSPIMIINKINNTQSSVTSFDIDGDDNNDIDYLCYNNSNHNDFKM